MLARLGAFVAVAAVVLAPGARAEPVDFDLVAHQGGPGGTGTGESLPAFANAFETGVSTLELDIGITSDRQPVVWHDEFIDPAKCTDTSPAFAGDPEFPYRGKLVPDLTLAQIRTLNCGNMIAVLPEVFALVDRYGAGVRVDIETKVDAEQPSRTAAPQIFVDVIVSSVRAAGKVDRVEIESFDWRSRPLVDEVEPSIPLVALWDEHTWVARSPWLAGVDPAVVGDAPRESARRSCRLTTHGVDRALVDRAHALSLKVLPWNVDSADDMRSQIDNGVDGIITNYPAVLRDVLAERGIPLPPSYQR